MYANNRKVEELFRSIKSDNSTFKDTNRKVGCETSELKQHFIKHFNYEIQENDPVELTEAPDFIKKLQHITIHGMQTNSPGFNELRAILKKLKNGKAANDIPAGYLKYAESSNELMTEMVFKQYETIWSTHCIPKSWGHSKLIAIWKGHTKREFQRPKSIQSFTDRLNTM